MKSGQNAPDTRQPDYPGPDIRVQPYSGKDLDIQFDTTFMYSMAVLIFLKVFQFRQDSIELAYQINPRFLKGKAHRIFVF